MSLDSTYKKLQSVSKTYKTIATSYKNYFSTMAIANAQGLKTNLNSFLFFVKDKLQDVVNAISVLQNYWFNALITCQGTLVNMGTTPTPWSSSASYSKGNVVTKTDSGTGEVLTYMCISAVTGAWDDSKWKLLTPNSLGFDWATDATITTSDNGVRTIKINNTNSAYILPAISYITSDNDALDGMVYLIPDV